jgi:uncharacterized protein YukE
MGVFGDPASIRALAGQLQGVAADVDATGPLLSGTVNRLVPASWSGTAASAFSTHWSGEAFNMSELGITSGGIATVLADLATALERANQLAAQGAIHTARAATSGPNVAMQQATQIAQQAWLRATMQLAGQTIPQVGPPTTPQEAETWATGVVTLPPQPGPLQQAEQAVQSWWQSTTQWWSTHGSDVVNVTGDAFHIVDDALLAVLGTSFMFGGTALDFTGVGALVGVPAAFVGLAMDGFAAMDSHGAVTSMQTDLTHLFSTANEPTAGGSGGTPPKFVQGELYETSIGTPSAGNVGILAEVETNGEDLTLKDVAIYSDQGTVRNQVGIRDFLRALEQAKSEARAQGFKRLFIRGVRVPGSSSANPGKIIDLGPIDLTQP